MEVRHLLHPILGFQEPHSAWKHFAPSQSSGRAEGLEGLLTPRAAQGGPPGGVGPAAAWEMQSRGVAMFKGPNGTLRQALCVDRAGRIQIFRGLS